MTRREILYFLSAINKAMNRNLNKESLITLRIMRDEFIALLYDLKS